MILDKAQIELLNTIQSKLKHGDIDLIATKTGLSRVYVSRVLSPNNDAFHDDIVKIAVEIISKRDQSTKQLLKKLTA